MIHSVRANDPRFKRVDLGAGLNVVVADTTSESESTDTRNGVGKTLLIEVLHFCLGNSGAAEALKSPELTGWAFTVDLNVGAGRVEVTRSLASPGFVIVNGDFDSWPIQPVWNKQLAAHTLKRADWCAVLGELFFGLTEEDRGRAYAPSFRQLFPYFARVSQGAFETPFKYFAGQREWQKQASVACLLGLSWEHASAYQTLKDQREGLRNLKKALSQGVFGDPEQTVGRLRAQRVRLAEEIGSLDEQLSTFEVHPEYREISAEANRLTNDMHALVNANLTRQRTIAMYEEQASSELGPDVDNVVAVFASAGVELSSEVRRTLEEAQNFHEQVVSNRQQYLADEIVGLRRESEAAEAEISGYSQRRAHLMAILEAKHALEELNRLNERIAAKRAELAEIDAQIRRITEVEDRQTELEIRTQELSRDSRREHVEREPSWSQAVSLFASYTEALYGEPGELIIDLGDNGFSFDVDIPRSGSHGVNNMKIFAFDLMLANRWTALESGPRLLWHDSQVFDGVDERQVGAALELADRVAKASGFQYFCSLNTDDLPPAEYLGELSFEPVLTLTDATDEGGLFGLRF